MNYKKAAAEAVVSALGSDQITIEQAERLMAVPPNPEMGDVAFPCFSLCKTISQVSSRNRCRTSEKKLSDSPESDSLFIQTEAAGDI